MQDQRIRELLEKFFRNETSEAEEKELSGLIQQKGIEPDLYEALEHSWKTAPVLAAMDEDKARRMLSRILHEETHTAPVLPIRKNKTWFYLRVAAVLAIIASTAVFFWKRSSPEPAEIAVATRDFGGDIAPGGNKAILTLEDGSSVSLTDSLQGVIGKGHALKEGSTLTYAERSIPASNAPVFNKLSTPRGGQFSLVLPDETKVWLNAASSIRYPVVFTGEERRVEITGEVYFEVSSNQKPFYVSVIKPGGDGPSSKAEIKVLGTAFNINAYSDEKNIITSLQEGKIALRTFGTEINNKTAVLTPGQQALITPSDAIEIEENGNMEEALAWKNGRFEFSGGIEGIMRQIARWYDVEVVYDKNVTGKSFGGGISRMENVSEVLRILELTGSIHFTVEGRTIRVQP